jgi:hypothetical protein
LPALHAAGGAFGEQHVDDLRARAVAEELALVLFVPGDAMALDQGDEVARRVARQGRAAEVGIGRVEVRRAGIDVGEIAASAAGDADLLGDLVRVVDDEDA